MTDSSGPFQRRTTRTDFVFGYFQVVCWGPNYQRFIAIEKIRGFEAANLAARDLLLNNKELKDALVLEI